MANSVNTFYGGSSYSMDEQVVGTWIDGKPIYRRIVKSTSSITIPKDTWITICSVSDWNALDLILFSFGRRTANDSRQDIMDVSGQIWQGNLRGHRTTGITCDNGYIIIVEFTKTTD